MRLLAGGGFGPRPKRAEPINPERHGARHNRLPTGCQCAHVLRRAFVRAAFRLLHNLDRVRVIELAGTPEGGDADVLLEIAGNARCACAATSKRSLGGRGGRLFRHALAHGADRRLGQQTGPRRWEKPPGIAEKAGRATRRNSRLARCRGRPHWSGYRVKPREIEFLAGTALPAARPHRVSQRDCAGAVEQERDFTRDRITKMPTSNQPRRTLLLTGASRGHRPRHRQAFFRRWLARAHLLATSVSRELSVGSRPRRSYPGRSRGRRANTVRGDRESEGRLNGELHALVNNAAISPKAAGGTRLGSIDHVGDDWHHVFSG